MIKDNHIKAAGGIKQAVELVKKRIPHTAKIEVETSTLDQVMEALEAKADIIMLDNMEKERIKEAVSIIDRKAQIEVSGNITVENAKEKAVRGVDILSSGSLTHSVNSMDISMKFK